MPNYIAAVGSDRNKNKYVNGDSWLDVEIYRGYDSGQHSMEEGRIVFLRVNCPQDTDKITVWVDGKKFKEI